MAKEIYTDWFKSLQDNICAALEQADGKAKFEQDEWKRPGGGGGRTRIIRNGGVIEKGGVNFSAVHGETSQALQDKMGFPKAEFYATGVSIVIHPTNPHVPIIHMNVRYFELSTGIAWFGGGIDLTPIYIVPQQAQFFHQELKKVCDQHHTTYYQSLSNGPTIIFISSTVKRLEVLEEFSLTACKLPTTLLLPIVLLLYNP